MRVASKMLEPIPGAEGPRSKRQPIGTALAYLLVVAGCLFFLIRGTHDEKLALHSFDFKQPYCSARCLLKNCNPYSEADSRTVFLNAGGSLDEGQQWLIPYSALYPPSTLILLAPLAALPYPVAHTVWLLISGVLFSLAALAMLELCTEYSTFLVPTLLSFFVASSTILLMHGQVASISLAFLAIGVWCLIRGRMSGFGVFCLGCSLALKPHDSWLVVLYFLFAGRQLRRRFWQICLIAGGIALAGCIWCWTMPASTHWVRDLMVNIRGNTGLGGTDDPGLGNVGILSLGNLQTLVSVFKDNSRFYNALAYGICALLAFALIYFASKIPATRQRHLLGIAATGCLTILPLYHREYDTRIMILVFPAIAMLLASRELWGWAGLALTGLAAILTCHTYLHWLDPHFQNLFRAEGHLSTAGRLQMILLYRPIPLIMLLLTLFFSAALYNATNKNAT